MASFPIQSKLWFAPVPLVLFVGYVLGGIGPIGIHYYSLLGQHIPEAFEPVLLSFLIGLLGANVQMSIFFAQDVNAVMTGTSGHPDPSCFDWVGYGLKLIWGGVAAVFFVQSFRIGSLAAVPIANPADLHLSAIFLISFCAGLRAKSVLGFLAGRLPLSDSGKTDTLKNKPPKSKNTNDPQAGRNDGDAEGSSSDDSNTDSEASAKTGDDERKPTR